MLLVLLSHFVSVYFRSTPDYPIAVALERLARIAAPTFVVISGVLLGFLSRETGHDFDRIRRKLIDRGLFLLTIGHLLLLGAFLPFAHHVGRLFMTDALGAGMIAGALLVPRLGRSLRLALCAAAYAAAWIVVAAWKPAAFGSRLGPR